MLKVMIVDNESAIRKGLVHCIHWGDLGCRIAAQADDGMMALEQIPVIQPNIVISDIRMPGMDGLELAEIIARDHPGIKVINFDRLSGFCPTRSVPIQYHVVDFVLETDDGRNLTNAIESQGRHSGRQQSGSAESSPHLRAQHSCRRACCCMTSSTVLHARSCMCSTAWLS